VLANPGVLEGFMNEADSKAIRTSFTGLYEVNETTIKMVLSDAEGYVMKPQREGGGNNIYGVDIPPFLETISGDGWSAYIFMDLIRTPPARGSLVKKGVVSEGGVISELGVYGVWVSRGEEVVVNEECGWLLRTKDVGVDEGGVASGFSVLDSVTLVD
jgi:hypothetical protein